MKIRTSLLISLIVMLLTTISILSFSNFKAQSEANFAQQEIPVVIKPLRMGNDIVPVEIQCQRVFITRPDTLDRFSCILINRTAKSIRASSVMYSIVVIDSSGKEDQSNRLDSVDTFIHPDLSDLKKPIAPGGTLSISPPGPIVEPDSVIKRLELEAVYIEFADGTIAGIPGKGAQMIANLREGAAKYKNSLRREYFNRGKSAQAILPLLEDNVPLGADISNFQQSIGAKQYRKLFRKKIKKNGNAAIDEMLNR